MIVLLEVAGIKRAYPEFVLEADFAVSQGEFFSILGPSGSGKTTLLRLVAGFDRPDAGSIRLAGMEITAWPPHKRRVGMVFQDYALFPHLSVGENVAYGLKVKGVPPRPRRDKAEELLDLTGLDGFYARDPSSLSGGEKQRVAVARALAAEPLVLLFDEPFSALDQNLRRHLRREIHDLQRRAGFTALFVTHNQEEALTMSDRLLVMNTGHVAQVGPPMEVYRRPGSEYVAGFLGAMNRLPVTVREGGTVVSAGERSFPVDRACGWRDGAGHLCFRPEACRLDPGQDGRPAIPVNVRRVEFAGATTCIAVEGEGWEASVLYLGGDAPPLAPGESAWLYLPLDEAYFVPEK